MKCRAWLGEAVGCARTGWTKARQRQQWAATAAALVVGCYRGGDTTGLGLGVRWRAGHGNGRARALVVKWLTTGKLDTGGLKAEEGLEGIWMEMKMSPTTPPPLPIYIYIFFFIEPWGRRRVQGSGRPNFAIVAKLLLLCFPTAKSTKILFR